MHPEDTAPEFSRRIRAADLEDEHETVVVLSADADERRALAKRFDLADLPRLEATVRLLRTGPVVSVAADLQADVVQNCVVSLELVPAMIRDRATRLYADPGADGETEEGDEIIVRIDEDDPPEPIQAGMIDIGEMVAEEMGVRLDPYPRRPGVAFDAPEEDETQDSPFAALGRLKPGRH